MWSRYTYFFKSKDKHFLYNSLSNSLAELGQEDYELLNKMKDNHLSLTDKELENGSNWDLVNSGEESEEDRTYINHKAIPIARIISRG